jgi:hypothetical protein
LKSGIVAFVLLSLIIGVFIAALAFGLLIALVLIILVIGALFLGFFFHFWRRTERKAQ